MTPRREQPPEERRMRSVLAVRAWARRKALEAARETLG